MSKVLDYISLSDRFNRSIRLEKKDFFDPSSLDAYVVTSDASDQINRILNGLEKGSGQRSVENNRRLWLRKSSFALYLLIYFLV